MLSHLHEIIEKRYPDMCPDFLIVSGDSAGGNMAVSMVIMSNLRNGPHEYTISNFEYGCILAQQNTRV